MNTLQQYGIDWVLDCIPERVREARERFGIDDILVFFYLDEAGTASDTVAVPRSHAAIVLRDFYPDADTCHSITEGTYSNPSHVVTVIRWRDKLFTMLVDISLAPPPIKTPPSKDLN
jgi:hypothetical protein